MLDNEKNDALEAEGKYKTAVEAASDYIENFDILETITNVGNDEVFTPRKTCEMILDSLPEEVWHNPNYKWLNPATKNGVFEREIALRLDVGLKEIIPNTEERRKHILQNMIYAIGQTRFTANVARRTVYYCSQANRKCDGIKAKDGHYVNGYAIGNGTWFNDEEGNIKTPNTNHTFVNDKGKSMPEFCSGAARKKYNCSFCKIRGDSLYNDQNQRETYAYEFIHIDSDKLLEHLQDRFFGGNRNMKFDIIIGNPPYQLNDGGGTGSSGTPIYDKFVEQAISLNPKYISMIIPSRWMVGGKGLKDFRAAMISDTHISNLHDFLEAKQCFTSQAIEGGVCYFLWQRDYDGKCKIVSHSEKSSVESYRYLNENNEDIDIFIRDEMALDIYYQVSKKQYKSFETLVSARNYFRLGKCAGLTSDALTSNYKVLGYFDRIRSYKYLKNGVQVPLNEDIAKKWKLFVSKADGAAGQIGNPIPARIMGKTEIGEPNTVCSETYLVVGPFNDEKETLNVQKYMKTKFFRFMVGIRKTKNIPRETYKFVPIVNFNEEWTDKKLYNYFDLSDEQINYIEKMIEEMK